MIKKSKTGISSNVFTNRLPVKTIVLLALFVLSCCGQAGGSAAVALKDKTASRETKQQFDELEYIEFLTGGAKSQEELPVIIAIHGLGDIPEHFKDLFHDFPAKARIILPRAPYDWGSGYAWFKVFKNQIDWNEFALEIKRAALSVARLIEKLQKKFPAKDKPVLCGFSQGGMVSFAVAVLYPSAIKKAVPVSGTLPRPLWPEIKTNPEKFPPIYAIHGTSDNVVPIEPTLKAISHLKKLGLNVTMSKHENIPHTVSSSMRRDLFKQIMP